MERAAFVHPLSDGYQDATHESYFKDKVHWGDSPHASGGLSPHTHPDCTTPTQGSPYLLPVQAPRSMSSVFGNQLSSVVYASHPDVELVSSDGMHFSVNSDVLRRASYNNFAGALQRTHHTAGALPRFTVPDTADVLNILLLTGYSASPVPFTPPFAVLVAAVHRMPIYGLDPQTHITYGSVLFECIRPYAAVTPVEVYALAAAHDLLALAQVASGYLLAYPLGSFTEAQAQAIGGVYLERLLRLHRTRLATLHELLRCPPAFHPETAGCSFAAQEDLTRAWTGAVGYVMKDASPDIVANTLQQKLVKLKEGMICQECRRVVEERIWDAVVSWTMAPGSI